MASLAGGVGISQAEALMASSPEFIGDHGGLDFIPRVKVIPVPVETFVVSPFFFGGPFFVGGTTGPSFTGGGFTGGFTGGFSGGGFTGGGFSGGGSGGSS
jgi:hypothetical protein